MKLIRQPVSLEVKNINYKEKYYFKQNRHGVLLPDSIRCIICGPSNCGKTNTMINLLLHENGLQFNNIYLYSKTCFQPKYQFLKEVIMRVPEVNIFMFQDDKDVLSLNEALNNSVIIFDDVTCENQNNIRNFFSMGRHKQIDCFYLSQTYSKIPKQLIRDNVNFLIIFKQDDTNLKHIYDEHVNSDLSWDIFRNMCSAIWQDPHTCLIINKDSKLNHGRYRKAFDVFINFD